MTHPHPKSSRFQQSGYTYCACKDCYEVVMSDDMTQPTLCATCQKAGCDVASQEECRVLDDPTEDS